MYTECPHCHAIFRVTQAILQAAGGKVRCGECATVFQAVKPQKTRETKTARENRVVHSESASDTGKRPSRKRTSVDRRGSPHKKPVVSTSSFHRNVEPGSAEIEPEAPHPDTSLSENTATAGGGDLLPKYLPIPVAPRRLQLKHRYAALLKLLAVVLVLLLMAQGLVANRRYLGTKPLLRPVVEVLCKLSGCKVPKHRDLAAIALLNHGVYSHPTVPGALMIKAVIENKAKFDQPYPVIELGFSDIRSKRVAMRRFGPSEYLDLRSEHPKLMTVNQPVSIRLEVIDPGKKALAFEFEFL